MDISYDAVESCINEALLATVYNENWKFKDLADKSIEWVYITCQSLSKEALPNQFLVLSHMSILSINQ